MAIKSGYFNSINGDRKYNAETMSKYFAGLISRGVLQNYEGKFLVTATTGMNIQVATGKAYFTDGKWIENDSIYTFEIEASDVVLNRIDRVVLRKDMNEGARLGSIILKKGTPATTPTAPTLESDELVEEISLATIYVGKLVESISQANITDTRADSTVCGFVTSLIDQVDTSDLYLQYQTRYNEQYDQFTEEFNEWFSQLREQISTSTLVREYTNRVYSSVQDQTVFEIGIANYTPALDILEVYINGLRLVNGAEYTLTGNNAVTLANGVDINQPIEFVVFKSVDGYEAVTVIEQVEDLTTDVNQLRTDLNSKAIRKGVITLPVASWVAEGEVYTQTAQIDFITSVEEVILVSPVEAVNVRAIEQYVGSLKFEATELPETDVHMNVANLGV